MHSSKRDSEMLEWLKDHPEIYIQLEHFRQLTQDDPDLEKAELELLEISKSIGAQGLREILQSKSDQASAEKKQDPGIRIGSKKN